MENKDNFEKIFKKEFSKLLIETFHLVLKTEMHMIKQIADIDLSMREVHLLQLVAETQSGATVSGIAKTFHITLASVTVMVQKLQEKGFLQKNKNSKDGRSVILALTETGMAVHHYHEQYHQKLVEDLTKGKTNTEKEAMLAVVKNLNIYFKDKL